MSVDLSEIGAGDEVLVRATVSPMPEEQYRCIGRHYAGENHISATVGALVGSGHFWVPEKRIVSHTKLLAVGDWVRLKGAAFAKGEIRAIADNVALVRWDAKEPYHSAPLLSDLERLPTQPITGEGR